MHRKALQNILLLISVSLVLVCAIHIFNLRFFFSDPSNPNVSPANASFIEGIIFITVGVLFLLGSGGINRASLGAVLLAATAEAVYDERGPGPSEIFRRDAWRPRGYTRLGLILIMTGIILLVIYFVSL